MKTIKLIILLVSFLIFGSQAVFADDLPGNVTGVNASAVDSQSIKLTWNATSMADHYRIYYDPVSVFNSGTGDYDKQFDTPDNKTTYVVKGLQPNTKYYFSVTAITSAGVESEEYGKEIFGITLLADANGAMKSAGSSTGTSPSWQPPKVTGLKATPLNSESIKLTWNSLSEAEYYRIYYIPITYSEVALDDFIQIDTKNNKNSYILKGLSAGSKYEITVGAINSQGRPSNGFDIIIGETLKSSSKNTAKPLRSKGFSKSVSSVKATPISKNAIWLNWDDTGANDEPFIYYYRIYYGTKSVLENTKAAKKIDTPSYYPSFAVDELKPNTQYYLAIKAVDSKGKESKEFSPEITVTTLAENPDIACSDIDGYEHTFNQCINNSISFYVSDAKITLKSLTNNSVTLNVSGGVTKSVDIPLKQTKKIDLGNNTITSIRFDSIYKNNIATLTLKFVWPTVKTDLRSLNVKGKFMYKTGEPASLLRVDIYQKNTRKIVTSTKTNKSGEFNFKNVKVVGSNGYYIVLNGYGFNYSQDIDMNMSDQSIEINNL